MLQPDDDITVQMAAFREHVIYLFFERSSNYTIVIHTQSSIDVHLSLA